MRDCNVKIEQDNSNLESIVRRHGIENMTDNRERSLSCAINLIIGDTLFPLWQSQINLFSSTERDRF